MVDFQINLAKSLTSTPEQRQRFYNGMLIYLVTCAALMVLVAYLTSINMKRFFDASKEHDQILATATAVSGLDLSTFRRPDQAYAGLKTCSDQISDLKNALGGRVQLLPVIHNLFLDLPEGVVLQSLTADDSKMYFDLSIPPSEDADDPVRRLTQTWGKNKVLTKSVSSIRPVKGERRTMGGKSKFYYKFECVLNK